jgi:chromosomal replication initiation ATPase DnaA
MLQQQTTTEPPQTLASEVAWPKHTPFALRHLLVQVAFRHGITPDQMIGPQRVRRFVRARVEFCKEAFGSGKWSSTQIGLALDRDHTTILYHAGVLSRHPRWQEKCDCTDQCQHKVGCAVA